jgi:lipoate-protein ligase B
MVDADIASDSAVAAARGAPPAGPASPTPPIVAAGTPPPAGAPQPGRQRELRWSFLGRVPYREAVALQEALRQQLRDAARQEAAAAAAATAAAATLAGALEGGGPRGGGARVEHLLLLEHPHVFTLGRNASASDVLAGAEWLAQRGVEVVESDRGGQVTYHGPGQLVGYPILDLSPDRKDVRRYVRDLEEVLIRTLAGYGIDAVVRPGAALIGAWVGSEKIAAIGVHLSRWITTHGFALNVATDLSLYAGIVPCGLRQEGITSIERLLGAAPPLAAVAARLAGHFGKVFGRRLVADLPPGWR